MHLWWVTFIVCELYFNKAAKKKKKKKNEADGTISKFAFQPAVDQNFLPYILPSY